MAALMGRIGLMGRMGLTGARSGPPDLLTAALGRSQTACPSARPISPLFCGILLAPLHRKRGSAGAKVGADVCGFGTQASLVYSVRAPEWSAIVTLRLGDQ